MSHLNGLLGSTSFGSSQDIKMGDFVRIVHCFILFWWAILVVKERRERFTTLSVEQVNLSYAHV